jgi:hypothetical protein
MWNSNPRPHFVSTVISINYCQIMRASVREHEHEHRHRHIIRKLNTDTICGTITLSCLPHLPLMTSPTPGCCYIQRLASGLADHRGEMKAAGPLLRSLQNNTATKKVYFLHFIWYTVMTSVAYDISVNCNWVATRWQQYSTHLHTNSTQNNTINNRTTQITTEQHKQQLIWKSAGRAPRVIPWHLPHN